MSVFKHFIVLQLIINYSIILAHNPPPHSILDLHWEECEHPLIYSMCYLCIIYLFYVFIYKLYAFSTLNNFLGHKTLTFIGLFFLHTISASGVAWWTTNWSRVHLVVLHVFNASITGYRKRALADSAVRLLDIIYTFSSHVCSFSHLSLYFCSLFSFVFGGVTLLLMVEVAVNQRHPCSIHPSSMLVCFPSCPSLLSSSIFCQATVPWPMRRAWLCIVIIVCECEVSSLVTEQERAGNNFTVNFHIKHLVIHWFHWYFKDHFDSHGNTAITKPVNKGKSAPWLPQLPGFWSSLLPLEVQLNAPSVLAW